MAAERKIPKIHVECSIGLLEELYEANEALRRARLRQKQHPNAPQLAALLVAIAGARARSEALLRATPGSDDEAPVG